MMNFHGRKMNMAQGGGEKVRKGRVEGVMILKLGLCISFGGPANVDLLRVRRDGEGEVDRVWMMMDRCILVENRMRVQVMRVLVWIGMFLYLTRFDLRTRRRRRTTSGKSDDFRTGIVPYSPERYF
jgi:hypothetical protein